MRLVGFFDQFLVERKDQMTVNITTELLNSTSLLLNFPIGWKEINNLTERYQTTSDILNFVDSLGLQHGEDSCEEEMFTIATPNISLSIKNVAQPPADDICFDHPGQHGQHGQHDQHGPLGQQGRKTICFPGPSLPNNCSTLVSTYFALEDQMDWMFPKTMKSRSNTSNADSFIMVNEEKRILEPQLVGLKIDNQSIELEERLIQVTFYHNSVEVS